LRLGTAETESLLRRFTKHNVQHPTYKGLNRHEDHEISMLSLHLIQNCMVYVNTLMIQKVLSQPHWQGKMTTRDYAALTPLIWEHVNPYGRFELDMNSRLALE